MQIITEKRNATVAGMRAQREFTVKVGAHIMSVLSGLYKNPVDAMVREYTTNMYDAWLALKRKNPNATYTPCELHLPTALSPFLVFKDYGVGMSFETVWEVYSQYGNSTKNDNNDEVGGFGLGSKTAFCYNNGQQWTIESRYNGELMTFMAFVGEDGIPNITHVTTVPTKESNGVTIRIPIRREHVQDVHTAARKYVPYFPMDITVINADKPITKPTYIISGNGYGIDASESHDWRRWGRTRIIMGNVPYDVDVQQCDLSGWNLLQNNVDLYVPIGTVDIVPSRDDLKYTDRTIAAVKAAFDAMVRDLGAVVSRMIDNAPTEWAAHAQFQNMNTLRGLRDVVKSVWYRGKEIDVTRGVVRTAEELLALDDTAEISCYGVSSTVHGTPEELSSATMRLAPNQHTYLMIDDLTKGAARVARAYCYTHLVNRNTRTGRTLKYGHTIGHVVLVKTKLTKQQLGDFFGGFPVNDILLASQVSGKVKLPAGQKGNDALYRFDGGKTWGARVNVPTGGPFYYLELHQDAYSKRWVPEKFDANDVRELLTIARDLKIEVKQLYGIKHNEVSTFDASEWKPLIPTLKDAAQKLIDADMAAAVRFQREITRPMVMMRKLIDAVGIIADFADFHAELARVNKVKMNENLLIAQKISSSSRRLGLNVEWPTVDNNIVPSLQTMLDKIIAKYPMIGVMIGIAPASAFGYGGTQNPFYQYKDQITDYITNR
jgi:hypothetical protein